MDDLRARVASSSMREVARSLGVSPPFIHDLLNGLRGPGDKIVAALGYVKAADRYTKEK